MNSNQVALVPRALTLSSCLIVKEKTIYRNRIGVKRGDRGDFESLTRTQIRTVGIFYNALLQFLHEPKQSYKSTCMESKANERYSTAGKHGHSSVIFRYILFRIRSSGHCK